MQTAFWIISCQSESSDVLRQGIDKRFNLASRQIRWHVSADSSLSKKPPVSLSQLTGIIIVVDRNALESRIFAEAVRLPVATVFDREDIAVFPWLKDVSLIELKNLAEQGNSLAAALVENIHLTPSMESLPSLIDMICLYVENQAKALKYLGIFQRLSLVVTREIGRIASIASVFIVLRALWTAMIVFLIVKGAIVDRIKFHFAPIPQPDQFPLSAVLALASIPITFFRFQCLDDLRECGPNLVRDYPLAGVEMLVVEAGGMAIGLSAIFLAWNCDAKTIVFGLCLGFMFVALSRKGRNAAVNSVPFAEFSKLLPHGMLLDWLYSRMAGAVLNTGRPLLEPFHKRVFISYARSSAWSTDAAERMADALRNTGAFVFQDRFSLQPGFSWKGQLRSAISCSNVFVVVLDEKVAHREWVAAEFATAFWIKMVKRTPEIFVIHPPDLNLADSTTPAGAFFRELLVKPSRPIPDWMRSRMGGCDGDNLARICAAIRDYRIAGAFGFLGNRILFLVLRIVVPSSLIVQLLGFPILIGLVLKPAALSSHLGIAMPLSLVSAFSIGNSFRDAIFYFAEYVRQKKASGVSAFLTLFFAIVYLVIMTLCLPSLGMMDILLLVPACFLGWECASFVATATRTWKESDIIK